MRFHPLQDPGARPHTVYTDRVEPLVGLPTLDSDIETEVTVVGGGITGLSAALHAAEAGVKTILLEGNQVGWGSSGRNQGQVVPALRNEPDHIIATFGRVRGERLVEAAGALPDLVFGLIEKHGIECEATRHGIITAAHSPAALENLRGRVAYWERRGKPVSLLSATETHEMLGGGTYVGACLDRRGGTINPLGYVLGLARAALKAGTQIFELSPARSLTRDGKKWRLKTPRGSVRTNAVLICTNAYLDDLWPGLSRTIVPIRAHQLVSKPLSDNVRTSILPHGQAMTDTKRMVLGMRMHPDGRLQLGGSNAATGEEGPPQFARIERRIRRVYPQITELQWEITWSGWMAMTPDHYPRLHELAPGVLAGFGYNGRGISVGTLMGRDLARRTAGAELETLIIPATPMKTLSWHPIRDSVVAAAVRYYRIRDCLDDLGIAGRSPGRVH